MQRFHKLNLVVALLFSGTLNGCSYTPNVVDTSAIDQSFAVFEQELEGQTVTILFGDGTTCRGKNLRINVNFTSWTDSGDPSKSIVPTSDVWRLQTTNHGIGGLKGLGGGLLLGAGLGVVVGAVDSNPRLAIPLGAVIFGSVGGILGLVGGTAAGSTTTYEINPELAPEIGGANRSNDDLWE